MKRIGIVVMIMALMLLLVSSVSAGDPPVVDGIPDVTMDEDTTDSSIDLDDYVTGTVDTWDCPSSAHITTSIDSENVLTLTPEDDWYGTETITCTAENGDGDDDDSFDVTVDPINDAPVVDVSDCTETNLIEDQQYTCTIEVTDVDDDDEDLTLTSSKGTVTQGTAPEWTFTWTPTKDEIGQRTVNFIAEDPSETIGTGSLSVFVRPEDVCGDYESGTDVKITDWDITDDDEDFYPGSSIEIEVDVENDGDDEVEDITVEAVLYDITDGKRIDVVKTDEFDLDEDEDETVELILEIPEDIDTDNEFVVFVSAYEDGNDDENCDWESNDDLTIKRRKHDVNIEKVVITPSTVKAGKSVDVKVDVENVGDRDEDDVYVKVKNGDLGIDKKSEIFDVDAYEKGDDDEYSVTITFTVPEDTAEGNYDLEIYVYDDDDEVYPSGTKFVTFYVEGTGTPSTPSTTPTGTVTITIEGVPEEVKQGKAFSIPVKLTNTADETKEYKITISNIGDWAESTSEKTSYLTSAGTEGDSETLYITITPNEDAAEGKHSATINVKEGTAIVATKTLSFTIPGTSVSGITGGTVLDVEPEGTGFFNNLFSGTTLWIIGDLVLVVVAIFFIRMLFSKKS